IDALEERGVEDVRCPRRPERLLHAVHSLLSLRVVAVPQGIIVALGPPQRAGIGSVRSASCARSSFFNTLPIGDVGSIAVNTISFGRLYVARRSRQNARRSPSEVREPGRLTTKATTSSPITGSGRPTTAASAMSGC